VWVVGEGGELSERDDGGDRGRSIGDRTGLYRRPDE